MHLNAGLLFSVASIAGSAVYGLPGVAPGHRIRAALPDDWSQPRDSPVYNLFRSTSRNFKRQDNSTIDPPAVGSPSACSPFSLFIHQLNQNLKPAWSAQYPQGSVDTTKIPAVWITALNAAVAAGVVPNIPQTNVVNDNPVYPQGVNGRDPTVCSGNGGGGSCRTEGSIWDAPDGVIGISFDDGPTQVCVLFALLRSRASPCCSRADEPLFLLCFMNIELAAAV